jgi:hypothetical protein
MGGTWGMKKGAIPSMIELLNSSSVGMQYGQDQNFMIMVIGTLLKNKILCHDSNSSNESNHTFPIKKTDILSNLCESVNPSHIHFIGEIFPADNYNKPQNHIFY